MHALHVIEYPNGRFGFVGSVPAALAVETNDTSLIEVGAHCGIGIAKRIAERRGTYINPRSWGSRAEAIAEAVRLGFAVQP